MEVAVYFEKIGNAKQNSKAVANACLLGYSRGSRLER